MEQTITVIDKIHSVRGTDTTNPIALPDLSEGSDVQPVQTLTACDLKYVVDIYELEDGKSLFVDCSLGYVGGVTATVGESVVDYLLGWDCPEAADTDGWLSEWGIDAHSFRN